MSDQLRVSISIGCGTKTGATNVHQRMSTGGQDTWALTYRQSKETVSWVVIGKKGQYFRDLGDNVLFAFCRSYSGNGNQK